MFFRNPCDEPLKMGSSVDNRYIMAGAQDW